MPDELRGNGNLKMYIMTKVTTRKGVLANKQTNKAYIVKFMNFFRHYYRMPDKLERNENLGKCPS